MNKIRNAKYQIGQVVRHRLYPFRGVVFDIDPIFDNTDEWYEAIPAEVRPHKDQPFYHLFAENDETEYVAYVSEQNLLPDNSGESVRHPQVAEVFVQDGHGGYRPRAASLHRAARPASRSLRLRRGCLRLRLALLALQLLARFVGTPLQLFL